MFCLSVLSFLFLSFTEHTSAIYSGKGDGVFRFANNYGSNMVLQRAPLSSVLWGFGEEGQEVKVVVSDTNKVAKSKVVKDSKGNNIWKVKLSPIKSVGPYRIVASSSVQGEQVEAVLQNVLFGDVWLCSGQSNMEFTVGMSSTAKEEIALADNYPQIRLFTLGQNLAQEPLLEIDMQKVFLNWTTASKDAVGGPDWKYFSAVCWMYGRRLFDLYKIPIGLIATDWGGTCVEAWSSPDALAKCGLSPPSFSKKIIPPEPADFISVRRRRNLIDAKEILDMELLRDSWQSEKIYLSIGDQNSYTVLWNAMIHPFISTTIKGAIWYQGERNNLINPDLYACTFPEMINDWRKKWHNSTKGSTEEQFPFGFVQLAAISGSIVEQRPFFPKIRYEQTANYGYVPNPSQHNVFMAVGMDLPDDQSPYGSIHPRDKASVADRLILGARALVYGENQVDFQGPILDNCDIVKLYSGQFAARVNFRGSKYGIRLKSLQGFEILQQGSSDAEWMPSRIIGTTENLQGVWLAIPTPEITMIRYAWSHRPCDYKECAVYSVENDLPSPPGVCFIPQ